MSKEEYRVRANEVIKKLNKVNSVLKDNKIEVKYSVYNYNGIASKLEKKDLYETDVTNALFERTHICDSNCMIDSVVKSCDIKGKIEIEECFDVKITDIENAPMEDLVDYFGNMNNHAVNGLGRKKEYQITYKGKNTSGQDVEIKALYGEENRYKVKKSVSKVSLNGTIEKEFTEESINYNKENSDEFEKVLVEGMETKTPDYYSSFEKSVDVNGKKVFAINSIENENNKFSMSSGLADFSVIDSVNFENKYLESNGKIKKASGNLVCRINVETGEIINPDFANSKSYIDASDKADKFYNKYKMYPAIKVDDTNSKYVVEGKLEDLNKLNLNQIIENANNKFDSKLYNKIELKEEKNY